MLYLPSCNWFVNEHDSHLQHVSTDDCVSAFAIFFCLVLWTASVKLHVIVIYYLFCLEILDLCLCVSLTTFFVDSLFSFQMN